MPRLTMLDDVFFPVKEHQVFVDISEIGREQWLDVPDKKAIVNRTSGRVLAIVGREYRLVTNSEALDMARECCRVVFPETHPSEWGINAVDAPLTAGYCHIDLVHNSAALDFSAVPADQRPDVFGPFIRVTNSYNTMRALTFDIGFYRKVCENGLILPQTIIHFKFIHMRSAIGERIEFAVDHDRLVEVTVAFTNSLAGLRDCAVSRRQFEPLICGVLQLRPPQPDKQNKRDEGDWEALLDHIADMSTRYASELGENAYAAFNAITDIASHPPANRRVHRDRHSLQRLVGSWLTSFNVKSREPNFQLDEYIAELVEPKAEAEATQ